MSYQEEDNCSELSYVSQQEEDQEERETRLIHKEKALFDNQRLTMEVAFDTIMNTTTSNQSRILALEETVIENTHHIQFLQDMIMSMEDDFKKKESALNKTIYAQVIELKKLRIMMEEMVPHSLSLEEERVPEKIQHLQDNIVLLHEIIECKDQIINSLKKQKN
jgi:hypothetical protein